MFIVILDVSNTTSAGFERWSNTPFADNCIISRGAGDGVETWWIEARDAASATRRAEREIRRSGVSGISVQSVSERLIG